MRPDLLELVVERPGWTAVSWAARLLQLAERCGSNAPARATQLRAAAELMHRAAEPHSACDTTISTRTSSTAAPPAAALHEPRTRAQ